MGGVKLCWFAHIYYFEQVVEWYIHGHFIGLNVYDEVYLFAGILPCFKAAIEVALYIIYAHAGKAGDAFLFFALLRNEYQWLTVREQSARPLCQAPIKTYVQRIRYKTLCEDSSRTGIQYPGIFFYLLFELLNG